MRKLATIIALCLLLGQIAHASIVLDDASTQYAQRDAAPVTAYPLSLVCWFKTDSDTVSQVMLWLGDKDAADSWDSATYRGDVANDPVRAETIAPAASIRVAVVNTGGASGAWHHVAAVFASASDRKVYYDGGTPGSETTTRTPTGRDRVSVGRYGDSSPGGYFSGKLAHCAVYDIALSAGDITELQTKAPNLVQSADLIAHWFKSDSTDGTDLTGNGHTLTLFNTPTFDGADNPVVTESEAAVPSQVIIVNYTGYDPLWSLFQWIRGQVGGRN